MLGGLINPTPTVVIPAKTTTRAQGGTGSRAFAVDEDLVYDLIRTIKDPEHPYTLEELQVVREDLVHVTQDEKNGYTLIRIEFIPTVPHCSLATLIGLCMREKLGRELPDGCKIDIVVHPGNHNVEEDVNKQINDKERIQAALENPPLMDAVKECTKETDGY